MMRDILLMLYGYVAGWFGTAYAVPWIRRWLDRKRSP